MELVNCVSVCALNVLNGNIKLSGCNTQLLQKYKAALRRVTNRQVSISGKKRFMVPRGGYLLPLVGAILPTIAKQIFRPR